MGLQYGLPRCLRARRTLRPILFFSQSSLSFQELPACNMDWLMSLQYGLLPRFDRVMSLQYGLARSARAMSSQYRLASSACDMSFQYGLPRPTHKDITRNNFV